MTSVLSRELKSSSSKQKSNCGFKVFNQIPGINGRLAETLSPAQNPYVRFLLWLRPVKGREGYIGVVELWMIAEERLQHAALTRAIATCECDIQNIGGGVSRACSISRSYRADRPSVTMTWGKGSKKGSTLSLWCRVASTLHTALPPTISASHDRPRRLLIAPSSTPISCNGRPCAAEQANDR